MSMHMSIHMSMQMSIHMSIPMSMHRWGVDEPTLIDLVFKGLNGLTRTFGMLDFAGAHSHDSVTKAWLMSGH